jgi:hypothetical protein
MLSVVTTVVEVEQRPGGTVTVGTVTDGMVTVVGTPAGSGTAGTVTGGNVPDAPVPTALDVVPDRAEPAADGFDPDLCPAD